MPKGIYKKTKEHIKNWVNSRKKNGWFKNPEEHSKILSIKAKGRKGYWVGRKRSQEDKEKMKLAKLGKTMESEDYLKKASETKKKKYQSGELVIWNKNLTYNQDKRIMGGEKHYNFKDWKSLEPYGQEFTPELRRRIRQRDNYTCQYCYKTQEQLIEELSIHHIDFNKNNNSPFNLISLCRICHGITQKDRGFWIDYYKKLQENRLKLGLIKCIFLIKEKNKMLKISKDGWWEE